MNSIDKLYQAAAVKGAVCVGLDTAFEYLPEAARGRFPGHADAILAYNRALVDATLDAAACYKVQIAYYEALGLAGLAAYSKTLAYIRERGGLVIADIKRGDIADTAERYAAAHFYGDFEADFVTLNPYMGVDSLMPWLYAAEKTGKGAFVLVRTSNPGMRDFEDQALATGGKLYDAVARALSRLAARYNGGCGYGGFGAVIGCTEREEAAAIRAKYKNLFFLIPGYGAQGGGAEIAAVLLKPDGSGGVVNASRSILKAWEKRPLPFSESADPLESAAAAARKALLGMRRDLRGEIQREYRGDIQRDSDLSGHETGSQLPP
ncbi:MAG: orotidine-5'-phosphate decarboxylase [Spirochaetaceae bacterium]|jgi:orotidine-5'-phosphate decarboxylase|nr:orotidine-5'-phosphate decarboxylase [Spirochaetaceae bacterium]